MTPTTTRRQMMKHVALGAGASLLSPILSQIAAQAAGAPARKRVIFVVQSNGMNPMHLLPVGRTRRADGKNDRLGNEKTEQYSLKDLQLHEAIEPLTPFKDRLALVQGLSGRIALSDHSCNMGALGCYPKDKSAMMQTIDHAVSDALPGVFKHVGLGLSGAGSSMNYNLSAIGPGQAAPIVCSPELAFKSLFGSVAEGAGQKEFDQRTNLLDFMADDVKRSRAALAGDERQKLDTYLAAFESLHARQKEIGAMRDALKTHAPRLGDKLTTSTSSLILEAQFEIAAAALIAGLTNVVTLASGGGNQNFGKFPEFNIPDLHHIGHGGSYGERNFEQCFVYLRQFHAKLIANLAKRLDSVKEGDGTMLDHSLIVYLSDSGESHHPQLKEWPVILLGNLGGKVKTGGRYLQLPDYGTPAHRTMANLYCTLLHAAGKPRDTFGVADPGLKGVDQTGIVAELL